jgi:hypothetical protein
MTAPDPGSPVASAPAGPPPPEVRAALQAALAAEHAAVWIYELITAFVPAAQRGQVDGAATDHGGRRDALVAQLRAADTAPVAAAAAYVTPQPVTDGTSALAAATVAESDTASAWRSVLERTDDSGLRATALDALTVAAVRATRWRRTTKVTPATVPFPGE